MAKIPSEQQLTNLAATLNKKAEITVSDAKPETLEPGQFAVVPASGGGDSLEPRVAALETQVGDVESVLATLNVGAGVTE